MNGDEARERFSEAYDDALDDAQRAAFDSALENDEALATEYAEFCELLQAAHAEASDAEEAVPDLLSGVQKKLRERSKGRFYRDRYAERGGLSWGWLSLVMLIILSAAWLALSITELK